MTETIYIPLQDEGLPVLRPALGYRLPDGRFIVLRPADYDAALETWAFPPGSIVECQPRQRPEGGVLEAVRQVAVAETTSDKRAG